MIPYVHITFQKFIPLLILKQAKICIENNTWAECLSNQYIPQHSSKYFYYCPKKKGEAEGSWGRRPSWESIYWKKSGDMITDITSQTTWFYSMFKHRNVSFKTLAKSFLKLKCLSVTSLYQIIQMCELYALKQSP